MRVNKIERDELSELSNGQLGQEWISTGIACGYEAIRTKYRKTSLQSFTGRSVYYILFVSLVPVHDHSGLVQQSTPCNVIKSKSTASLKLMIIVTTELNPYLFSLISNKTEGQVNI